MGGEGPALGKDHDASWLEIILAFWHLVLNPVISQGTWVAQSVECPTLYFGSGHDFRATRRNPVSGFVLSEECAWDSLLPSPTAPPPSKNNINK